MCVIFTESEKKHEIFGFIDRFIVTSNCGLSACGRQQIRQWEREKQKREWERLKESGGGGEAERDGEREKEREIKNK